MAFNELDAVILNVDLRDPPLKKGLLGAVVDVIGPKRVLVEFVAANGRTVALVPIEARHLRKPTNSDALAVAPVRTTKGRVIGPFSASKRRVSASTPPRRSTRTVRRRRSA